MLKSYCRKLAKQIVIAFSSVKLRCEMTWKRNRHGKLVVLISTAYWGNVGDHAIVLGEKKIIKSAGKGRQIVELDSMQYALLKHSVKNLIKNDDIIIIDGGGNFGDVWPETQLAINDIIHSYSQNKIIVFPESWYFTNSDNGRILLANTVEVINDHPNIVIYARDSYSFSMMKKYMPSSDIRQSLDTVFFLDFNLDDPKGSEIALVVRDDRESINTQFSKAKLENYFRDHGISFYEIKNDCYHHIPKRKRKQYVRNIVAQYKRAKLVITDRFHGMVLSILCRKPCVIIDNKTGKVRNSYNDIKKYIDGILCIDHQNSTMGDVIEFANSKLALNISEDFEKHLEDNMTNLINELRK